MITRTRFVEITATETSYRGETNYQWLFQRQCEEIEAEKREQERMAFRRSILITRSQYNKAARRKFCNGKTALASSQASFGE